MVYKKYIKKNGKSYGPYIYHSRRVNGKVISEYHGSSGPNYKRFILFIFGILFLISIAFFIFNSNGKITGKSISEQEIDSQMQNSLSEEKIIYPAVYFTLISRQVQDEPETEEQPDESQISENQDDSIAIEENIAEEPQQNESGEIIIPSENITPEQPTGQPSAEESEPELSEPPQEQQQEESVGESAEQPEESETEQTEEPVEEITPPPANVILGILRTVSNFFLGLLKPTGMAVSESMITEIKREVSANEPFIYDLKKGESVELLSGSVKTNSKSLSDNVLQIIYENNRVLISTNYSEIESASDSDVNQTNETVLIISNLVNESFNIEPLTEEENKILEEKLGNISVERIKTELFNGRYIIGYGLGEYNIEYSYDADLDNEILNLQMENDKIKWLRDIIKELSREKSVSESVDLS